MDSMTLWGFLPIDEVHCSLWDKDNMWISFCLLIGLDQLQSFYLNVFVFVCYCLHTYWYSFIAIMAVLTVDNEDDDDAL